MKTLADFSFNTLDELSVNRSDLSEKLVSNEEINKTEVGIDDTATSNPLFVPDSFEISSASFVLLKESKQLTLKRTQAITDLHIMDDYSPVTFESTFHSKPESDLLEDHSQVDYIEENKLVITGINVRAAKINKLIEILIESFGKQLLYRRFKFNILNRTD